MNKKGFTLIELLAVIVILAVIALIVTPTITGIIGTTKTSANKRSVEGHVRNVEYQITQKVFNSNMEGITYDGTKTESELALTYPSGDNITCESYKIVNNLVAQALYCKEPTWDKLFCYAQGKETEECVSTYKDNTGSNPPILESKMIPVKYNGTAWEVADISKQWYNYDNQEWANAVVLNNDVSKKIGDTLNMDTDISMMYVWIPRYKYTIFNGNNGAANAQQIDVTFESGTQKTGTVTCTDSLSDNKKSETCSTITNGESTYTHPAFTFGDKELTGIWVGKFENSNTNTTCLSNPNETNCNQISKIVIKPTVHDWRFANVSIFFESIKNIGEDYGMSNIDSHMMKNSEWGAVAYLKQSKYGTGINDMGINNVSTFITGCGASITASSTTTCNEYNTSNGMLASTTGNVTGVYDMSGGSWEYVMGNQVDNSGNFYSSNAGFTENIDSKYYDKYSYDADDYYNYAKCKLGDATKEIIYDLAYKGWNGWTNDYLSLPQGEYSWFIRGGHYDGGANGGIFDSLRGSGKFSETGASRSVIVHNS